MSLVANQGAEEAGGAAAARPRPRCLITDFMGDDLRIERETLEAADVVVDVAASPRQSDWLDLAGQADAVITRHASLDRAAITALRRCRVIARYGTGVDNIDSKAAQQRNIVITYVPGGSTAEVADHAMGLILMAARRMLPMAVSLREGGWAPAGLGPIRRLQGLGLGLIGGGRIGRALGERAAGFGMEIAVFDPALDSPSVQWAVVTDSIDDLLRRTDVLSLHLPLMPETRGLIGARELELLRPGAIVVNTARGGVLDLGAARSALESGDLGGLALDTFPEEPLLPDDPLRREPNAVLTPHMAYLSTESLEHAKRSVVSEVLKVLSGAKPDHPWRDETE